MKRITILIISLLSLGLIITQAIAINPSELSWIIGYINTTVERTRDIITPITYEYTCLTDHFTINNTIKYAWCYERTTFNETNQTWSYNILFSHNYDYGYKPNKTMYWITNEKTGEYIDYINTTIQNRIGASYQNKQIIFEDCNIYCSKIGDTVTCDSTRDGNGDGILQSGESGFSFNINKLTWYNLKIKSDSSWYNELKNCIVR